MPRPENEDLGHVYPSWEELAESYLPPPGSAPCVEKVKACLVCGDSGHLRLVNVRAHPKEKSGGATAPQFEWLCRRHLHLHLELYVETFDVEDLQPRIEDLRARHLLGLKRCCVCQARDTRDRALTFYRPDAPQRSVGVRRLAPQRIQREVGDWVAFCPRHKAVRHKYLCQGAP